MNGREPRAADLHMSAADFRRHGRALVDWIADYLEHAERYPVQSRVAPGEIRAALPDAAPRRGEPWDAIWRDVERVILPGVTHWQSPGFFGFWPANVSGPAILGELLSAGLGVQGMLWLTSPACTELETHVLDWLVDMLGLPARFRADGPGGGVILDTASSATLCALLAARDRATGGAVNEDGAGAPLVAYASAHAHSSVEKAVRIAGLGTARLRTVPVDGAFAMRPDALRDAMDRDAGAGLRPCYVCATVGTTASGAVDPLGPIGEACAAHGAWLHVDAAAIGTAAICPEHRGIHEGLERADSYCVNPHKWMLTNFDCDCFYVADRRPLLGALSILPEYLRNAATESGAVIDYRDWQIPLGRRFRALKLWFVIRHYGVEGLREHVRRHVALARELAGWIEADDDFELAAPPSLNLVCFRHRAGDEVGRAALEAVNRDGRAFLTHAVLDGRYALRMAIGQPRTTREHVERAWTLVRDAARARQAAG